MRLPGILAAAAIAITSMPAMAGASSSAADEAAVRKVLEDSCEGFKACDFKRAMALYRPGVRAFDMSPPQQLDYAGLMQQIGRLDDAVVGKPYCAVRDIVVKVYGDNAYAHYLMPVRAQLKDGRKIDVEGRGTDLFERSGKTWFVVHERFSVPVDIVTGQAEMKPPAVR